MCKYIEMLSIQMKEDMTKLQEKKIFSTLNLVVNLMLVYLVLHSLSKKRDFETIPTSIDIMNIQYGINKGFGYIERS